MKSPKLKRTDALSPTLAYHLLPNEFMFSEAMLLFLDYTKETALGLAEHTLEVLKVMSARGWIQPLPPIAWRRNVRHVVPQTERDWYLLQTSAREFSVKDFAGWAGLTYSQAQKILAEMITVGYVFNVIAGDASYKRTTAGQARFEQLCESGCKASARALVPYK